MLTKSVAIIDDELDLVNLFREALQMDEYTTNTFTDPIEALHHIQKTPEEYSLVISDCRMPKMNGNDLCTKLKNLNPQLKVILISAYEEVQYDSSKFKFLNKPIPISQLLKIVKETLDE
jgi:DNA-binding NtrC family response regulator